MAQKKKSQQPTKKRGEKEPTKKPGSETLKGWTEIGAFLGLPPATAQRWARDGMPVKREGRFATANRAELQKWLGKESHMSAPAKVVTAETDLAEALKESIKTSKAR
jgi:hypothetical protein